MQLVRADGNWQLQRALTHAYVITIVDILIDHLDQQDFLEEVTDILQSCIRKNQPDLQEKLQGLFEAHEEIDTDANTTVAPHILKVAEMLERLYQQNEEQIRDQRGAIVELLGYKLISTRYTKTGICGNSKRFVDEQGRPITIQEVDVAALCPVRKLAEAYECKVKINNLDRQDCTELMAVHDASATRSYRSHVGVISFDSYRYIRRKLATLEASLEIKYYGIENISNLADFPFI